MANAPVSSSTPNNTSDYRYDVFLNHRGPDMKKGFAGHLYHRLRSHGIRVFLDKQEMKEGDNLTSQIIGAINTASVHVAIFSENYAESNWCLKELVLMLESSKSGATIIPVFHGVKPADLRWTQGEYRGYAQGLHKLKVKTDKGKRRYDPDTIEEWRRALARVADISGFELEACNGDEGELVEKIDERVSRIVKKERFNVPKYEIGLDVKVKDFEAKFLSPQEQDREKPQAVGIVGLRGVGKTTLAKELFHRKSSSFIRSYFLSDVRENASESTDTAIRIWRGSGWRGLLGFQSLLEKQLVEVDSENCINMHDHLKDLGKTIAKKTGLPRPLGPLTDNNACLSQNSSSVITGRKRKIDDLLQQSSAITELREKIDDLLQQSSAITEMPGKIDDLLQQSSVITELREKIDGLVQQSSVITELREKIDGLVQQSSV